MYNHQKPTKNFWTTPKRVDFLFVRKFAWRSYSKNPKTENLKAICKLFSRIYNPYLSCGKAVCWWRGEFELRKCHFFFFCRKKQLRRQHDRTPHFLCKILRRKFRHFNFSKSKSCQNHNFKFSFHPWKCHCRRTAAKTKITRQKGRNRTCPD